MHKMKTPVYSPNTVLMLKPVQFGFNEEASATNKFQQKVNALSQSEVQEKALQEFNLVVEKLKEFKVNVLVYNDSKETFTPDSIFPNNWISTHSNGMIFTYPMLAKNRQLERRKDIVLDLFSRFGFSYLIELEDYEDANPPKYLEGTGSMVLDHQKRIIYASISPRTDENVLAEFAKHLRYKVVSFTAYGAQKEKIYHTNVMMCVGEKYIIIGENTIAEEDRERVMETVRKANKAVIELTNKQVYEYFAGNMLQLRNNDDETVLVMSGAAYNSLTKEQLKKLNKHNDHLLRAAIPTIEKVGGGSARCMLAEVYLPELA
jgi:hypothetical protein